jgi:hypothetical protein
MDKFPYSSAPLRRVKGVQFGILDPEFLVICPLQMMPIAFKTDFMAVKPKLSQIICFSAPVKQSQLSGEVFPSSQCLMCLTDKQTAPCYSDSLLPEAAFGNAS